ncbi:MAG: ParB N-terminal domain-containing protein [Desulfurococcales archaeon]|nr:ParB N-terminal domain-containing protein [Desulfurococcales archaeon]
MESDGAGLSKIILIYSDIETASKLALIPIRLVKPHEQVMQVHVNEILRSMEYRGFWGPPILVENKHYIILDGHHRVKALEKLNAKWVPALLVDYWDPRIQLDSWRPGVKVSKKEVIKRGLHGFLYPHKTTRHKVNILLPIIKAPLEILRNRNPVGGVMVEKVHVKKHI